MGAVVLRLHRRRRPPLKLDVDLLTMRAELEYLRAELDRRLAAAAEQEAKDAAYVRALATKDAERLLAIEAAEAERPAHWDYCGVEDPYD